MGVIIKSSTETSIRNKKILLWGGTGSRKSESILRYFPDVCIIDTEGNVEQCVDVPEIKPFIYVQTKSTEEVIQVVKEVASGKIKMANGAKVRTLALDGASILWNVRQEVAANVATARAKKYNKSATQDDINISMADWNVAKRPLKQLNTLLANLPVEFVILTAREKDLMVQRPGATRADDVIKVGVTMEAMKGLEYEMNLALHLGFDSRIENGQLVKGPWYCEVTKVQGSLGNILPMGKRLDYFPAKEILAHSKVIKTSVGTLQDESEVAKAEAEQEVPYTKEDLWAYALSLVPDADQKEIFTVVLPESNLYQDKIWRPELKDKYEQAVYKWSQILNGQPA